MKSLNQWLLVPVLIMTMITTQADAHGENRLGPNGGYVRMPGPFHTELVPSENNSFKVYLLDMEWKNPSIKDSRVTVSFHSKEKSTAQCKVEKNFYICSFDPKVDLTKKGELIVQAKREGQVGNEVKYLVPLALERPMSHSKHKM